VTALLSRSASAPPVRIVHMGLGAFSRSHLAWYTDRAADSDRWGISAYTGRSRALADALSAQDGLYTLVERGDEGDRMQVVSSIVSARSGDELPEFLDDVAAPDTAIISLTVTERGYRLAADGLHDADDPEVASDDAALRDVILRGADPKTATTTTALGRLLLALEHRRRSGAGAVAVMSCDNLPDNGGMLRRGLLSWAHSIDQAFGTWLAQTASFPSSSVDRITPGVSGEELAELGVPRGDRAPVIAEPFSDWVIQGDFPAGRPEWHTAGATFVDELAPWEDRKLWMLNGAHTLLACLGLLRGHVSVADAIVDDECRSAVEAFWDEASAHLPSSVDPDRYRADLVSRFANRRIEHRLSQIALHSQLKLALRVAPVALREIAAGRSAGGSATAIAAWIRAGRDGLLGSATPPDADLSTMVAAVSPALAASAAFLSSVETAMNTLSPVRT